MKLYSVYAFIQRNRHYCFLVYAAVYVVWFHFLERTVTRGPQFHVVHCAADEMIPFIPLFIIPYLLWFAYVGAALVVLDYKDADEATHLGIFLACGMTICLMIFTFFPNGTDFRIIANPDNGICSALTWLIQRIDPPTNVFPSIHVYNSMGVNDAIWRSRLFKNYPVIRWGSLILMVLICFSTVFLKQHSLLDVAGAMILAYFMDKAIYGKLLPAYVPLTKKKKLTQTAH